MTMVFVPSLTTFAVSTMLGGGRVNLIGNIIEQEIYHQLQLESRGRSFPLL